MAAVWPALVAFAAAAALASAQEPEAARDAAEIARQAEQARPVTASVEPVTKRLEDERAAPCDSAASKNVPCFHALVVARKPEPPLAVALRDFTKAEAERAQAQARANGGFVSFDPVCAVKAGLKALKGRNDTYHLYWVHDRLGDHPELRDTLIDPAAYASAPEISFTFVRTIHGECEAIAAFRAALHTTRTPGAPAAGPRDAVPADAPRQ
jgi:hypothetical protein